MIILTGLVPLLAQVAAVRVVDVVATRADTQADAPIDALTRPTETARAAGAGVAEAVALPSNMALVNNPVALAAVAVITDSTELPMAALARVVTAPTSNAQPMMEMGRILSARASAHKTVPATLIISALER